ncbi:MAG: MYG1 family protein [Alphaproteobacteria bacterium]|nr:MYG1 family protein [Alphaproteobacteria bacterium]
MIHTILTHPGSAHKDDVLAVCVLAAKHDAPVLRRVPTPQDLADPGVVIVDVGGVHDPARSNFDHHHFPREHPPTCALSLVLQAEGLYEDALQFCDWLETAEWFDARGPNRTAEWLGVPRRALSQLSSPVDGTLLKRFSQRTELLPGDPLHQFMRFVGEDLLEHLALARSRLAFVGQHAERWAVPAGEEQVQTLYMPRVEPLQDGSSDAVGAYIRAQGLGGTIAAIVYPDRRGPGFGIGRYEDHPRLDFSRVGDEPDVHFAHVTGFMCKTTATTPERLQALIAKAWLPAGG